MTGKYIYADVEKPFHFWVREGQRWILRDATAHPQQQDLAARAHPHASVRHDSSGHGQAAA